jgi:hypothetical protein
MLLRCLRLMISLGHCLRRLVSCFRDQCLLTLELEVELVCWPDFHVLELLGCFVYGYMVGG